MIVSPGFAAAHAAGPGRGRGRRAGLLRAGAGLAAARPGRAGRGSRSPAPTARPPRPPCWRRSCARPGCAPPRSATSASRSSTPRSAPDRFDVLAVELSSFQLHWSSTLAPQVGALLNLADDHLEWHGTFDAYAAAKFEIWRSAAGRRRRRDRQPRRSARRGRAGRRSTGPPGRVHPRPTRRRGSSASSTGCWSTAPFARRRRARADRADRDPPGRARTTWATRCAAAALARAYGVPADGGPRRARRVRARAAPQRAGRHGRRGGLRRRQQGHQPARGGRLAGRLPARSSGSPAVSSRASTSTTWWPRVGRPAGAARCCSASIGPRSRRRSRRHAPERPGRRGGEDR